MSDIMRPIPYEQLLRWAVEEHDKYGSIFGVRKIVRRDRRRYPIFGGAIGTVYGPAAGPNTQLAQNIAAAYAGGSSWFELKTVQKMDGRELAACVNKPCILAEDEGYNCEWSTELEVGQALEEYIKAWFLVHLLAIEYNLGNADDVVFNMSVGYDLEGIRTPKVNHFIDTLIDAKEDPTFLACMEASENAVRTGLLKHVTLRDVSRIPSKISNSVTESTLHGCPPKEIESIASYLLRTKHLNTFVKCNPTLLGYDYARKTLDELGFDYIAFDDHHFTTDLQWEDAVPMLTRLQAEAEALGLEFGVKLTNTFPVDVTRHELPSTEMYMSGRSLFPLTIELARRIAAQFDGKLRISFCGGADFSNIHGLVDAGVWPVTVATTILKPGGYDRMAQFAQILEDIPPAPFSRVDIPKVTELKEKAMTGRFCRKPLKGAPSRKNGQALPLMDCFHAPCRTSCPIHQDIPGYLHAMEEGRIMDALRLILWRNPLPFITGTICPHTCADRCMRGYYEEGLHIRDVKLQAAVQGYDRFMKDPKEQAKLTAIRSLNSKGPESRKDSGNIAIVGGGPAGLSAAYFLTRAGLKATIFERSDRLGGVVAHTIPHFRIDDDQVQKDIDLCLMYGANVVCGRQITDIGGLFKEGFTDVIVAVGAWKPGRKSLTYGEEMDALDFLTKVKYGQDSLELGEDVAVIGGGNTAMDAARAAVRQRGVKHVRLIYRRTERYMPADEEELAMALEDDVEFLELLSPVGLKDGQLECAVMELGEMDASGRRSVRDTGERTYVKADTVISAVGERIDAEIYRKARVELDPRERPVVDGNMETSVDHIYAIGDGAKGPATVVKAIADAAACAKAIADIDFDLYAEENASSDPAVCYGRKGVLAGEEDLNSHPDDRCLGCAAVCEVCADVCPNRANVAVHVPGLKMPQIVHMDGMCNECGNCAVFCPYSGRPYKDKLTLFWSKEDMDSSENQGFLVLPPSKGEKEGHRRIVIRLGGKTFETDIRDEKIQIPEKVRKTIQTVIEDYPYLLKD